MLDLLTVVGLAVAAFVATNIDDILLLAVFFADRTLRPSGVLLGQFIGIGSLTFLSAAAALLTVSIPSAWIALLGLLPLGLGIRGLLGLLRGTEGEEEEDQARRPLDSSSQYQWLSVAAVTVANGSDNLGVYVPLFSREPSWIPVYVIVFTLMTAVWCAAGYGLVNHPLVGARVRQYGHVLLPFVLVGLGLLILWDARPLLR